MFGSLVLYFASMTNFHSFPSPEEYLLSQEASRQMFTSLRQGMPRPPWALGMQTKFQLAKCSFFL
jgi:hypothetical protein